MCTEIMWYILQRNKKWLTLFTICFSFIYRIVAASAVSNFFMEYVMCTTPIRLIQTNTMA